MDLTSKQRAQLRGLANSIDTILHVARTAWGQPHQAGRRRLEARELIKGKVLENSMLTAREAAEALAKAPAARWSRSSEQSSCYIVKVTIRTRRTGSCW